MSELQPANTLVLQSVNRVWVFCKGSWVYKDYPSNAHAVAAYVGLDAIDDDEQLHNAAADWTHPTPDEIHAVEGRNR